MDYISNSFMMPFISLLSAILIGWIMKPSWIAEENGTEWREIQNVKKLYKCDDALYYAGYYGDSVPAVNRCVESDYEIIILEVNEAKRRSEKYEYKSRTCSRITPERMQLRPGSSLYILQRIRNQ